jgi:hypothetical protein
MLPYPRPLLELRQGAGDRPALAQQSKPEFDFRKIVVGTGQRGSFQPMLPSNSHLCTFSPIGPGANRLTRWLTCNPIKRRTHELGVRVTRGVLLCDWNSVPDLVERKAGGFASSEEFLCHV